MSGASDYIDALGAQMRAGVDAHRLAAEFRAKGKPAAARLVQWNADRVIADAVVRAIHLVADIAAAARRAVGSDG